MNKKPVTMQVKKLTPNKRLLRLALLLLLPLIKTAGLKAQTYVNAPVTGTPAAGAYYSNTGIVLTTGFSFTATGTSSVSYSVLPPGCAPLITAPTATQNYVVATMPRTGGITTAAGLANRSTCDVQQTIQYFDGLGRPLQTVQVMASPQNKDIITPAGYDGYGREVKKYLPYADETNAANGSFRPTVYADQATFYSTTTNPPAGVVRTAFPFSQGNIEFSPLNRNMEQGAQGADWQPGNGHTVRAAWGNNDAASLATGTCRWALYYTATVNADQSRSLVNNGAYPAQGLYVTISKDENWVSGKTGTTEQYTDRRGNVVLKRLWYNETTAYST